MSSIITRSALWGRSKTLNLYRPTTGDGCVLWLLGQDDAPSTTIRDKSGNNNHGTITNGTWAKTSQGLKYLEFAGTGQVTVTHSASINLQTYISVWSWAKCTDKTDYRMIFCKQKATSQWQGFNGYLNQTTGTLTLEIRDDAGNAGSAAIATDFADSKWHFFGLSIQPGSATGLIPYVDGTAGAAGDISGIGTITTTNDLYFGVFRDGSTYPFYGGLALEGLSSDIKPASWWAWKYRTERDLFKV